MYDFLNSCATRVTATKNWGWNVHVWCNRLLQNPRAPGPKTPRQRNAQQREYDENDVSILNQSLDRSVVGRMGMQPENITL